LNLNSSKNPATSPGVKLDKNSFNADAPCLTKLVKGLKAGFFDELRFKFESFIGKVIESKDSIVSFFRGAMDVVKAFVGSLLLLVKAFDSLPETIKPLVAALTGMGGTFVFLMGGLINVIGLLVLLSMQMKILISTKTLAAIATTTFGKATAVSAKATVGMSAAAKVAAVSFKGFWVALAPIAVMLGKIALVGAGVVSVMGLVSGSISAVKGEGFLKGFEGFIENVKSGFGLFKSETDQMNDTIARANIFEDLPNQAKQAGELSVSAIQQAFEGMDLKMPEMGGSAPKPDPMSGSLSVRNVSTKDFSKMLEGKSFEERIALYRKRNADTKKEHDEWIASREVSKRAAQSRRQNILQYNRATEALKFETKALFQLQRTISGLNQINAQEFKRRRGPTGSVANQRNQAKVDFLERSGVKGLNLGNVGAFEEALRGRQTMLAQKLIDTRMFYRKGTGRSPAVTKRLNELAEQMSQKANTGISPAEANAKMLENFNKTLDIVEDINKRQEEEKMLAEQLNAQIQQRIDALKEKVGIKQGEKERSTNSPLGSGVNIFGSNG
jgi:hypothetical protein